MVKNTGVRCAGLAHNVHLYFPLRYLIENAIKTWKYLAAQCNNQNVWDKKLDFKEC